MSIDLCGKDEKRVGQLIGRVGNDAYIGRVAYR